MKTLTKIGALCLVLVLLTGCAGDPLPTMQTLDLSGCTLEEAAKNDVTISYDPTLWEATENNGSLFLMCKSDRDQSYVDNLQVLNGGKTPGKQVTPANMLTLVKSIEDVGDWFQVGVQELRMLGDQKIIYLETTIAYTEEYLEQMVAEGTYTREQIDSIKDVLLQSDPIQQIQVCTIVNGYVINLSGSYMDPTHKQRVLDAITIAVQTIK